MTLTDGSGNSLFPFMGTHFVSTPGHANYEELGLEALGLGVHAGSSAALGVQREFAAHR